MTERDTRPSLFSNEFKADITKTAWNPFQLIPLLRGAQPTSGNGLNPITPVPRASDLSYTHSSFPLLSSSSSTTASALTAWSAAAAAAAAAYASLIPTSACSSQNIFHHQTDPDFEMSENQKKNAISIGEYKCKYLYLKLNISISIEKVEIFYKAIKY